jgi:hypothetical protein
MAQDGGKQQNTAYGVFVQACWVLLKPQYPDELIHIEEFNRQCSDWWYDRSKQERKRFQKLAERSNKTGDKDRDRSTISKDERGKWGKSSSKLRRGEKDSLGVAASSSSLSSSSSSATSTGSAASASIAGASSGGNDFQAWRFQAEPVFRAGANGVAPLAMPRRWRTVLKKQQVEKIP